MPSSTWWGMQHLNENVMAAVSIQHGGPDPDLHNILEICVLPLDSMLEPHPKFALFQLRCKPDPNELFDLEWTKKYQLADCIANGQPRDKVADYLMDWFDSLKLRSGKKIVPLGYNWPFERYRLERWLGTSAYAHIFSHRNRDVLTASLFINDMLDCRAEPVRHAKTFFPYLCKIYNIEQLKSQTCTSNCLATAQLYKKLLQYGWIG